MSKDVTLQDIIDSIELPWPEDIFGGIPDGELPKLDEFAKSQGYRIDNISADLMRRGWKVFKRQLKERLAGLEDLA